MDIEYLLIFGVLSLLILIFVSAILFEVGVIGDCGSVISMEIVDFEVSAGGFGHSDKCVVTYSDDSKEVLEGDICGDLKTGYNLECGKNNFGAVAYSSCKVVKK